MRKTDAVTLEAAGISGPAGLSLPLVAGLAVFATIVLLAAPRLLADGDTYWHIAAGRWIIAHGAVPHADPFSYTMPGAPWVPHEWLAEIVFAWLFDQFGWAGPVVATAAALALALGILTRALLRFVEPVHALIGMASAWGMTLPHLLARPHVFSLPVLVLWVAALVSARAAGRAPAPAVALLMVLWANLHGSFMLGLALVALLGAEAAASANGRRAAGAAARGWGVFFALSLGAALLTPNGVAGVLLPIELSRMPFVLSVLGEWRSPNFQQFQPLEAWLMVALLLALGLRARLPWLRILVLLPLIHMALAHQRQADVLALTAPLLIAAPAAAEIARLGRSGALSAFDALLKSLAPKAEPRGLALAAALALVLVFFMPRNLERGLADHTPAAALAAVAAQHVDGPVLNEYAFGGYLIFSGIPVFIDGRADMYGDAFVRRYYDAMNVLSQGLPDLLEHYGVTWTLLDPRSPGVVLLDHLPGWRRLYADGVAVVHVRTR